MRPGREMDARIAREIFGHEVWASNRIVYEKAPLGKRPLRAYSKEMEWAWEVANKMRITLVPIQGGQWFAFATGQDGWETPQAFADFLQKGDFKSCGASLGEDPAFMICEAALRSLDNRKAIVDAAAAAEAGAKALENVLVEAEAHGADSPERSKLLGEGESEAEEIPRIH